MVQNKDFFDMIEEWKEIEECEGFIVSNTGKVINTKTSKVISKTESVWSSELNLDKRSIHKNTKVIDGRMVRMDRGYVVAHIKGKSHRVHRLVATAFLSLDSNPEQIGISLEDWNTMPEKARQIIKDCMHINHKDHDKTNNNVFNLEYMTPQENAKHSGEFRKSFGKNIQYDIPKQNTLEGFLTRNE